jgi:3-hydroxyisobutyrate dehydrogenase-like beta-hydroxyacid dehydrogenase
MASIQMEPSAQTTNGIGSRNNIMSNKRVGLIGVGLLGTALAERMHQAGFAVSGYDLNWSYLDQLQRQRPELAATVIKSASANQLASNHDTIVMCLPDSAAVELAIGGIEAGLRPGSLVIDATTGDPDSAVQIAARLAQQNVGYIDATIVGSSEQARQGQAVVVIGGAKNDVERASPIFESWSSRRFHVGVAGAGQRLKLVINLVLGLNRAVLAEGLNLARAAGVDPATALDVLKATPAYSTVMDTKGAKMVNRDYATQARLSQHLKDVTLIRALARRHGAATPLSDAHQELLELAANSGFADVDNSAVIEAYARFSTIR